MLSIPGARLSLSGPIGSANTAPWSVSGATVAPSWRSGRARIVASVATFALVALLVPGVRDVVTQAVSAPFRVDADDVRGSLDRFGMWAPLIYVVIQVAQVLVPFLPGAPVTFAGVLLFGWQAGLALSLGGFALGSAIQFAAVRRWGRPLVARMVGEATLDRYAGRLDPRGWWLLAAFLVPFAPADAFSALAGLTRMSFRRFMLVSFLGRLPWAMGTTLLAAGVVGGSTISWMAAGLAVLVIVVLGIANRGKVARLGQTSPPTPLLRGEGSDLTGSNLLSVRLSH
jgi:uncharacterized membrane protein YdjX (TVP38/TMEM64 family)